jgi:hypothetical protein
MRNAEIEISNREVYRQKALHCLQAAAPKPERVRNREHLCRHEGPHRMVTPLRVAVQAMI